MRRIYILPNLVTTGNLFCGFLSMISAHRGDFLQASYFIILGCICDLLDGRIARMAKATSEFGVEYDSLSDLTSFGIAPAFLMYLYALVDYGRLGWAIAFVYLACGAFRLARFNVTTENLPKAYFQGLPSPLSAALAATFIWFSHTIGLEAGSLRSAITFVLTLSLGLLMVSSIPFLSFKEVNWRSRGSFGYLLFGLVGLVFLAIDHEITLFLALLIYLLFNLGWFVYFTLKGKSPLKMIEAGTTNDSTKR
jgi:CDP-diacylglycerol--serine O-phosphatidyltransferase